MGELLVPLPEGSLREWFVAQRWFGSKATEVAHLNILESFTLREDAPQLVLALIEARFPQGTHEVYQVPIGIRPASEGWADRVIAEVGDSTYYDALADPAHARELLHLMRAGADVHTLIPNLGGYWFDVEDGQLSRPVAVGVLAEAAERPAVE